jgi:RNA polymerase sigma-70 factor (ECF subfamily)
MSRTDDAAIEELVAAAKAGDAEAFGRLFDHFHEPVHRYVAARVRRPSDAEDLAQTVFVKALEALPRYEQRGVPFGGWLFRLARNVVIDHLRTHREHVDLDELLELPGHEAGPEAQAVTRDQMDAVAAALAELTDEQRDAIALRFFAGLSAREAAVVMDKQEGTVRGIQFRAIGALRRRLGLEAADGAGAPARRDRTR